MEEEVLVCLVQFTKVIGIGIEGFVLWILGPAAKPLDENVSRRLQIDHEIRSRNVLGQQIVEPLVDEQLVVVEIQIRKDFVLVEQVVTHRCLRKEVSLLQADELTMAIEQIKELRLQRRAR